MWWSGVHVCVLEEKRGWNLVRGRKKHSWINGWKQKRLLELTEKGGKKQKTKVNHVRRQTPQLKS